MRHALFSPLSEPEAAKIHFALARYRPDTILVTMTLVGERVEVDVFDDSIVARRPKEQGSRVGWAGLRQAQQQPPPFFH